MRNHKLQIKLNKGLKKLARLSALSTQAKAENILVMENFDFESPKTKEFTNILKALSLENKKALFVLDGSNNNVYLSSRNLKRAKTITNSGLSTYEVLNANKVILLESSLDEINQI